MPGRQGIGFRKEDQVFELQEIVQLHLFLGKKAGFLFLGDQGSHALASLVRCSEIRQRLRWNLFDQKIQNFVTDVHE